MVDTKAPPEPLSGPLPAPCEGLIPDSFPGSIPEITPIPETVPGFPMVYDELLSLKVLLTLKGLPCEGLHAPIGVLLHTPATT